MILLNFLSIDCKPYTISFLLTSTDKFPGGSDSKASAYNAGDLGSILGGEDPLEKEMEMATHSSILAWGIPWMRSMTGYSPWGSKDSHTF